MISCGSGVPEGTIERPRCVDSGKGAAGEPARLQISALVNRLRGADDQEVCPVVVRKPRVEHRVQRRRRLLRKAGAGAALCHTQNLGSAVASTCCHTKLRGYGRSRRRTSGRGSEAAPRKWATIGTVSQWKREPRRKRKIVAVANSSSISSGVSEARRFAMFSSLVLNTFPVVGWIEPAEARRGLRPSHSSAGRTPRQDREGFRKCPPASRGFCYSPPSR